MAATAASPEQFDYFDMFVNLSDEVIIPGYVDLSTQAGRVAAEDGSLNNWCSTIGSSEESAARVEAQSDWQNLMTALQRTEVHLLGPVVADENALHNRLLTPADTTFSTCGVDQSVLLSREAGFDLDSRLPNQKGLGALEYLLFNSDLEHTCPVQIPETRDWNQRPEEERKRMRCEHALVLAADVASAADELVNAWQVGGSNFRAEFAHPDNHERFLEELSDALFYVEKDSKDRKLGRPLGLNVSCSQVACPDTVEFPWSETSLESVRANLLGFIAIFGGNGGLSFDDIIASEGLPEIAEEILLEAEAAVVQIDSMGGSLLSEANAILASGSDEACVNSAANPDGIQSVESCSLYGLVKRLTDSLRTDFITIVNLDLPDRAQSDND